MATAAIAIQKIDDRSQQVLDAIESAVRKELEAITATNFHGALVVSVHVQAGVLNHLKVSRDSVHKIVGGRLQ